MPTRKHAVSLTIEKMGEEVFNKLTSTSQQNFDLSAFRKAFADVAHKRGIFHGKSPGQYNFHFRDTMKEVKRLIKEKARTGNLELF